MDSLISMMSTGTPEEFAGKLGLRRSTLFQSLQEMREMGVDIRYSFFRQSYYYADSRRIKIRVENTVHKSMEKVQNSISDK
jgi:predicted transcriptional regulator